MKSRDDYEFVLAPWELSGAPFDTRPDAVAEMEVAGVKSVFLLKKRANRVFFRLEHDNSRHWATTEEIEGDFIEFWRQEVAAKRIARLFAATMPFTNNWFLTGSDSALGVLVRADGTALLCEWCSEVWFEAAPSPVLEKYVRTHQRIGIWDARWQPKLRQVVNRSKDRFDNRYFPESERDATKVRWVRGSEMELQTLLECVWVLEPELLPQKLSIMGESIRGVLHGVGDVSDDEGYVCVEWVNTWAIMEWVKGRANTKQSHQFSERVSILDLFDVFFAYNNGWGVNWLGSERSSTRRGDWHYKEYFYIFEFPNNYYSNFQRADALRYLQNWLTGKVPDELIPQFLELREL